MKTFGDLGEGDEFWEIGIGSDKVNRFEIEKLEWKPNPESEDLWLEIYFHDKHGLRHKIEFSEFDKSYTTVYGSFIISDPVLLKIINLKWKLQKNT